MKISTSFVDLFKVNSFTFSKSKEFLKYRLLFEKLNSFISFRCFSKKIFVDNKSIFWISNCWFILFSKNSSFKKSVEYIITIEEIIRVKITSRSEKLFFRFKKFYISIFKLIFLNGKIFSSFFVFYNLKIMVCF